MTKGRNGVSFLWQYFCVLFLLYHLIVFGECLLLNIHMPLKVANPTRMDLSLYSQALASNLALREAAAAGAEQVDLFSNHTAHITLYLVDFDVQDENGTIVESKLQTVLDAVQQALVSQNYSPCRVDWPLLPTVQDGYAMYFVSASQCLQELSDRVVNATMQYIRRPPVIPDWIHSLPEPERKKLFERIQKFGSPNVHEGFNPHVTVGYDAVTPRTRRLNALENLYTPQPCLAHLSTVAVGLTGVAGTVLQDGELLRVPLNNEIMGQMRYSTDATLQE